MGGIRPDVHQMGDGLAAPALGDAFEQFAHLEAQHDEHGLGELRLGAGRKPMARAPSVATLMRKFSSSASPWTSASPASFKVSQPTMR